MPTCYFLFLVAVGGGGGGLVTKLCLTLVNPWTIACQAPLFNGCEVISHYSFDLHFTGD